jgi:hypothetical protein
MFDYEPVSVLAGVHAPIVALRAGDDADGGRARALADCSTVRVAAGRDPIRVEVFERDGHNLMRYRPDAVSAAILSIAERSS